jgi:predicted HD superfamily hydrolase involved in NAD metabolism
MTKITEYWGRSLSPYRRRHVESVARWARELARRHGADPGKAYLAGKLHDAAKEWTGKKLESLVRRENIRVPGLEFIVAQGRRGLLHAHVSAWVARETFGVGDREILRAIARHTLGARRMGLLDKVIYVADFSSPDRRYAEARRVRRLARRDLDAAVREAARCKIQFVLEAARPVHPATVAMWNALCGAGDRRP